MRKMRLPRFIKVINLEILLRLAARAVCANAMP